MEIYQQIGCIAKILLLAAVATVSEAATYHVSAFDDWIVSGSCSQNANKLCKGYYKQPRYTNVTADSKQPVTITSDEANFVSKGTSVFIGNVVATKGDKIINADKATVVHNAQTGELETITAEGSVKIMQPGLRVDGTKAVAYVGSDRKVIDNAVYRIYERHARGAATSLVIDGQDNMKLNPASYTTCAPDSNAWLLQASKTDFDRVSGRGEAWHAKMYLKDVPVFYWPYVNFPIDKRRQTGFLQPELESSSQSGKSLILPFYWNIAPNYDSTIRTNVTSRRGLKLDTLWRYMTRTSNGSFNFDFLPDDKVYKELRTTYYNDAGFMQATDTPTKLRRNDLKPRDRRYRFAIKNSTNINKNLLFTLDYNDASDGNYLYDFTNDNWSYVNNHSVNNDQVNNNFNNVDNQYTTVYALQRAALQYDESWGTLKYQLEQYKTFHVVNGPNGLQQLSKLPQVSFNSATFNLPYGFNWAANANFAKFRPRLITDNDVALNYGQRFQARPSLMYLIFEPGWFLQPRVQVNHVEYSNLHISKQSLSTGMLDKKTKLTIPIYDVKGGLILERATQFNNNSLLQTLEPQLYYLCVPNRDQNYLPNFDSGVINFDYNQVFRDNRYTGLDRVAEANQLGLGLASKLFRDDSGEEQGMIGIGRIRYMRDKVRRLNENANVDKHWSPVAITARWHFSDKYNIEGNLIREKHKTNTATLQLQYRASATKVLNFGYEFLRNPEPDLLTGKFQDDIKQVSVSSAWQITTPVRILAKASYDLRFHRELNMLAGFEYHTCCTALRFVWTKDYKANIPSSRDYAHRFRLQFVFKGFGGVGNAEDTYINGVIPGYGARDK